jgi:hypothetical protein
MTLREKILQASYYSHLKAAEELARVGEKERADKCRDEANKISIQLNETK